MSLSSMTGFARASGASGPWRRVFELKSVNAQKSKISNRRKIKRAGWSNEFLAKMLAQI
jgi:uncharacterized protein YicC (UPF0701 family)